MLIFVYITQNGATARPPFPGGLAGGCIYFSERLESLCDAKALLVFPCTHAAKLPSWVIIHPFRYHLPFLWRVGRQVAAFLHPPPDKSVLVLILSPLIAGIRMAEIDLRPFCSRNQGTAFYQGCVTELHAVIGSHGMELRPESLISHGMFQAVQCANDALECAVRYADIVFFQGLSLCED